MKIPSTSMSPRPYPSRLVSRIALGAAFLLALQAAQPLLAADVTWSTNGTSTPGGDGDWTGGSFWWNGSSAVPWTDGDNAFFTAAGNTTVNSSVSVNTITFSNSAANISILGGAGDITLNSGITAINTADATALTYTISESIALGASQTWGVTNGGATGTANLVVSGNISGTGYGITKDGNGTLTLSGANSYSGGTLVSAGTLQGNSTSLQGAITNNAAVIFNNTANGTYASVMSGTGTLAKTGGGALTLSGTNTYTGTTTVSAGTLILANTAQNSKTIAGDILINGGTLNISIANQIADTSTVTMTSGNLALGQNETFKSLSVSGGTMTLTGAIIVTNSSAFTGGSMTTGAKSASLTLNGPITLGNFTFGWTTGGNFSFSGINVNGDISVNAATTVNFAGSSSAYGQLTLSQRPPAKPEAWNSVNRSKRLIVTVRRSKRHEL